MTMKSNRAVLLQHSTSPTTSAPATLPRRVPAAPSTTLSIAELRATTEIAYLERERQLFEQVAYELAAGGEW